MTETQKFNGSCHCGKVRYEVTTALTSAISCNCSICSRAGYLLTFVPESQFKLLSGEDNLTDYLFNKHHIHHVFCKTCGIHAFAQGKDAKGNAMRAINIRCLADVDLDAVQLEKVDGKSA